MNTARHLRCTAAFALSLLLSGGAVADVITLRADEWRPYNCAPDNARPGIMVEIAKRVLGGAGHKVDYQVLNWARAVEETRKGKYNGIIGAAHSDAEDFIFPEEELGKNATAFGVRKGDKWRFTGVASLRQRRVGIIRNYTYGEALDLYVAKHKNDESRVQVISGDNALEINLRKLQRGRIDTLMEGDWVLRYTIASMKLDKSVEIAGVDKVADPLYIAFSPNNPKSKGYAQLLSDGVTRLRASGELNSILAKYGVRDWK